MPRFIDHHDPFPMPPADQLAALRVRANAPAGTDGVKMVNVLFATNGSADCISDAPSADAVIAAHAAIGVPLEAHAIREVTALV